ncbi:MAG: hypothetical protein RL367_2077, partial [Pseudomonadota bacterium]
LLLAIQILVVLLWPMDERKDPV